MHMVNYSTAIRQLGTVQAPLMSSLTCGLHVSLITFSTAAKKLFYSNHSFLHRLRGYVVLLVNGRRGTFPRAKRGRYVLLNS